LGCSPIGWMNVLCIYSVSLRDFLQLIMFFFLGQIFSSNANIFYRTSVTVWIKITHMKTLGTQRTLHGSCVPRNNSRVPFLDAINGYDVLCVQQAVTCTGPRCRVARITLHSAPADNCSQDSEVGGGLEAGVLLCQQRSIG
jgi:hypothetical protein